LVFWLFSSVRTRENSEQGHHHSNLISGQKGEKPGTVYHVRFGLVVRNNPELTAVTTTKMPIECQVHVAVTIS